MSDQDSWPVGPNQTIVGTCSCCQGPVTVPTMYHSIVPPVPTCQRCGAKAAPNYGRVIPMTPNPVVRWPSDSTSQAHGLNEWLKSVGAEPLKPFKWPDEVHVEGTKRRYVTYEQQPGHTGSPSTE